MATQPTQNPVPSESPRDLKFNAGKIDQFATSQELTYTDRLGNEHYTIDGLNNLALQAIAAFGYVTIDSFQDGATLSLPNEVLRDESTGQYYRWAGDLPKIVQPGSTPQSSGGIGLNKWLSVSDGVLRSQLGGNFGFGYVGGSTYNQIRNYNGDATRTYCLGKSNVFDGGYGFFEVDTKDTSSADNGGTILVDAIGRRWKRQFNGAVDVLWFAKGDGVTNDAPAAQKALLAAGRGGNVIFSKAPVNYLVTETIYIDNPVTIKGMSGSPTNNDTIADIKAKGAVEVFKIRANLDGYMFGYYGMSGVHFENLMLEGQAVDARSKAGICTDNTVNAGVYHIRGCSFTNVQMRYFQRGWNLAGVCYLNEWFNCRALWCDRGCNVDKVPGATEGASDQNNWFGCEFVLCGYGAVVSELGHAGSNSFHGCTFSEGNVGVLSGYNTILSLFGGQIENNKLFGVNVTIPANVNPNSEGAKIIQGVCFLGNNVDIVVDKTNNNLLSGGFAFPFRISGNTFSQTQTRVLAIYAPTGAKEFDSRQFIFSSDNAYSGASGGAGPVPPHMIEPGWLGYNGYKEDGKVTTTYRIIGNSVKNVGYIRVPYGKQIYIKYQMNSMSDDAGSNLRYDATVNFVNATTSTPSLIKTDTGKSGEFYLTREQIDSGMDINIQLAAQSAGQAANLVVSYNII